MGYSQSLPVCLVQLFLLRQGPLHQRVSDPQLLTLARLTGCQNLSPLS